MGVGQAARPGAGGEREEVVGEPPAVGEDDFARAARSMAATPVAGEELDALRPA